MSQYRGIGVRIRRFRGAWLAARLRFLRPEGLGRSLSLGHIGLRPGVITLRLNGAKRCCSGPLLGLVAAGCSGWSSSPSSCCSTCRSLHSHIECLILKHQVIISFIYALLLRSTPGV